MKKIIIIIIILYCLPIISKADSSVNELRVTLQSSFISLDPGGVQDSQSLFVSRQVNCQLVRNQGSSFTLDAAESIRYITPLKILVKINKNAKFYDGSPVTARDAVASLNYIKESRNIFKNVFTWIKTVTILDDKTIVLSLEKHVPQFLKTLSATNFTIFKESFLDKAKANKSLWKNPIGCGKYRVSYFGDKQIRITPVYSGLPIVFTLIKSNQIEASEVGKYDIITLKVIGESKELNNFNVLEMFDPIQYFIGINSKSRLWKNKYDRCKFLSSLDLKNVISSYGESAIVANDLLPKGTLGYSQNNDYLFDLKRLANKSSQHSLNKEKSICFSYLTVSIQDKNKVEYVKMLQKHYSNVVVKPIYDVKRFGKKFLNDNCDVLILGLTSTYLDGYEFLTVFEKNDANFTGENVEHLNAHILQSQNIENTVERAKEYQKITKEIADSCIVRPIFTMPIRRIYVRKNLKAPGIGLISIHQYNLANVSI
ncbi:MAG: ABC transporter substrate-binding protein [Gammaproteobacteria bacterium]